MLSKREVSKLSRLGRDALKCLSLPHFLSPWDREILACACGSWQNCSKSWHRAPSSLTRTLR